MSKLDWMYKSSNTVDPEDYLLGKAIDKNFEAQGSFRNEVDKDILPTSIFANSNCSAPVDIIRKLKEDPLEQIKQKEIEMRKQLLKNPVKLKKLQSMLKAKAEKKDHSKKKKKSKSKDIDDRLAILLQKYGTEKVMELTKSDDSDDADGVKSKGRSGKSKRSNTSDSSSSSDESTSRLRDIDKESRKRSKDRSTEYRGKKKVKRQRSRSASSGERGKSRMTNRPDDRQSRRRNRSESCDGRGSGSEEKKKKSGDCQSDLMRLIKKHGAKKLMELVSDDSEDEKPKKKKEKKPKARSESSESTRGRDSDARKFDHKKKPFKDTKMNKARRRNSSADSEYEKSKKKDVSKAKELSRKHKQREASSSSYSPSDDDGELRSVEKSGVVRASYSSEEEKPSKKAFGLVLPKGVEAKPKPCSHRLPEPSNKKAEDQKRKFVRHKPTKLTEEEKEAKLKEMMTNAQWRDKERKTNVAKYREEEKREADSQKYDEGFMRKELAKAVDSSKSVEDRIKSRMNNVQRSKFSMNQNFARRT